MRGGARGFHERVELSSLSLAAGPRFHNLPAQLLEVAQDRIFIKRLSFRWIGVGHVIVDRDRAVECKLVSLQWGRMLSSRVAWWASTLLVGLCSVAHIGAEQDTRLRVDVELVLVDTMVVDRQGAPIVGLQSTDFDVSVGGRRRKVVSAGWVNHKHDGERGQTGGGAPLVEMSERRRFMLAVDEHSFAPGAAKAAMQAAGRFIERLSPTDLVGLYTFPAGAGSGEFTTDHAAVRKKLDGVVGMLEPPPTTFNLTRSEITDISSGDAEAWNRVAARECGGTGFTGCRRNIQSEAVSLAGYMEIQLASSLSGLRGLIRGLGDVDGRKSLVLVSGGLFTSDRSGGRVNMGSEIRELGREAAQADINLYVLHMDSSFIDAFSTKRGITPTLFRDSNALAAGLEMVAGAAGGAVYRVQAGNGDFAFDRVLRETSAHYVVGVEVDASDRDGKPHPITVRVRQRGATVRHRAFVIIPVAQPK